jgi:hypothetical protein
MTVNKFRGQPANKIVAAVKRILIVHNRDAIREKRMKFKLGF